MYFLKEHKKYIRMAIFIFFYSASVQVQIVVNMSKFK